MTQEFYSTSSSYEKTDLGVQIARAYVDVNQDSAKKYFENARLLLDKEPDVFLVANYYKAMGYHCTKLFDNDKAIGYLKKSDSLYSLIDSVYDIAIVNTLIGNCYENKMDFDSSLYYYELSIKSIDSSKYASLTAANLNNMANVYKTMNDVNRAMNCYLDALTIFKKTGQNDNASIALRNIAILNLDEKMPEKAVEYITQAIAINKATDNKYELCSGYNILGIINRELQNYDSAIANLNKAIEISELLDYDYLIAMSNHNMGMNYFIMEEYDLAISHFRKSLKIVNDIGIVEGKIPNIINIGRVYTNMGNYSEANDHLFNALELCKQSDITEYNEGLYLAITTNFEKWEKYNLSLEYFQLYSALRDSLLNIERLNELHSIQVQYETEQKELENQQLKSQNDLQELTIFRQRIIVFAFILISIIGIYIIITLITLRKKRKKRIALLQAKNQKIEEQSAELIKSNATKDKLFSIISHDLRSPFNSLMGLSSLINIEAKEGKFDKILNYSENMMNATTSTLELIDNLLNWSRTQQKQLVINMYDFNLKSTVDEIIHPAISKAELKQIKVCNIIDEKIELFSDINILMVIIRNLVFNAIKFTPIGGEIKIGSSVEKDQTVIYVSDNGVGMEQDVIDKLFGESIGFTTPGTESEQGSGLGLMLVNEFVQSLNGKVWVDSTPGKGSIFSFSIPNKK